MDPKLEELAQYIRQTLPQAKSITRLQINEQARIVTFTWHAREFIVKPTYEVLELKGNNLFITGASMLIQAAFTKKDKNEKVLTAIGETLLQVEEMASKHQTERALTLLETVKQTLQRLIGSQSAGSLNRPVLAHQR
jgi:hypothetical protein